jgi:hypothetical protein
MPLQEQRPMETGMELDGDYSGREGSLSELTDNEINEMSMEELLSWCNIYTLLDDDAVDTAGDMNIQHLRELVINCRNELNAEDSSDDDNPTDGTQKYTRDEIDQRYSIILFQLHYRDLSPTRTRGDGGRKNQIINKLSHKSGNEETPPFLGQFRATRALIKRMKFVLLLIMDLVHIKGTIALRELLAYVFGKVMKIVTDGEDFMQMSCAMQALRLVINDLSRCLGLPRMIFPVSEVIHVNCQLVFQQFLDGCDDV